MRSFVLRLLALGILAMLLFPASGTAATYPPKGRQLYMGVSDGGSKTDYFHFAKAAGQHIPVMQAFETWNAWSQEAIQRWKRTETRGMLSISTTGCYGCGGVISPRSIRKGEGDRYLLTVNRKLAEWGKPTYIRLLPEMNGHWNPYAAFNEDGSSRGRSHKTAQFRKAWKRSVIIIKGGRTKTIDHKLRKNKMPPLKVGRKGNDPPPRHLPEPKVSFLWVPQTAGSPNVKGNGPRAYWPGGKYVDWIGADIYGKYPNFSGLNALYKHFPQEALRDRRVGALGRRPAVVHAPSRELGAQARPSEDGHLLPGLRAGQPVPDQALPGEQEGSAARAEAPGVGRPGARLRSPRRARSQPDGTGRRAAAEIHSRTPEIAI